MAECITRLEAEEGTTEQNVRDFEASLKPRADEVRRLVESSMSFVPDMKSQNQGEIVT